MSTSEIQFRDKAGDGISTLPQTDVEMGQFANNNSVESNDIITINVGGVRHEVLSLTLQRFQGTRLANLSNGVAREGGDPHFIASRGEFYFDRHPGIFTTILNCYRTGELHMEGNVCGCELAHELEFWGMNGVAFQKCCTAKYVESEETKTKLTLFEKTMKSKDPQYNNDTRCGQLREKVWAFLDNPFSTLPAKVFGIWTILVILLSIVTLCLETVPSLRDEIGFYELSVLTGIQEEVLRNNFTLNISENIHSGEVHHTEGISWQIDDPIDSNSSKKVLSIGEHLHVPNSVFVHIDYVLFAYFTLELIIRFIFSPHKLRFLLKFYTICDILALIPGIVINLTNAVHPENIFKTSTLDIVRALTTARILRLVRFARFSMACKVLYYTLKASMTEIFLMLGLLLFGAVIFASLMYFGELISASGQDDVLITSIPTGIWYAIVTMTTVGYGDFYPKTIGGYIVGSGCVICGVLVIAFTVPVIVSNFIMFYAHGSAVENTSGEISDLSSGSENHPRNDKTKTGDET